MEATLSPTSRHMPACPETRTIQEILDALAQPIPRKFIKKNNDGKDYLPASIYRWYLTRRAPYFESLISTSVSAGGRFYTCDLSITIAGADGRITRSANGFCAIPIGDDGKLLLFKVYGDPASNAASQALKKICRSFGLGRMEES